LAHRKIGKNKKCSILVFIGDATHLMHCEKLYINRFLSSDIIRIRLEKIRKYSLFDLEYEFECVRILTKYSNSKLKFKFEIKIRIRNFQKYSNLFESLIIQVFQIGPFYTYQKYTQKRPRTFRCRDKRIFSWSLFGKCWPETLA
jgi:hypothetical protein